MDNRRARSLSFLPPIFLAAVSNRKIPRGFAHHIGRAPVFHAHRRCILAGHANPPPEGSRSELDGLHRATRHRRTLARSLSRSLEIRLVTAATGPRNAICLCLWP